MSITLNEHVLSLSDAIRSIPRRNGRRVHLATMYRWTSVGCRGVVLDSIQCGRTRCTSREALERFFSRLSAASGKVTSDSPVTPTRRDHLAAVEQELDESGI